MVCTRSQCNFCRVGVDWPDSLKGNMTGRNWETFSSKKGSCVKNWQWSAYVGGGGAEMGGVMGGSEKVIG